MLTSRGLFFDDTNLASRFLENNNYYRLNVYFHKFMDYPDHFIENSTLSEIIQVYMIDSLLRKQMVFLLEPLEIKLKSRISYYLGMKYGPDAFYRDNLYKRIDIYEQLHKTFDKEIFQNFQNPVVLHHQRKYGGEFPIWVVVEFLSFNAISKFYSNLGTADQKAIAIDGLGINEFYLRNWIHSLSVVRNICAHYGYLYKRDFAIPISFGSDNDLYRNYENSLFAVFYCLQKLSEYELWKCFSDRIAQVVDTQVLIQGYGFPVEQTII